MSDTLFDPEDSVDAEPRGGPAGSEREKAAVILAACRRRWRMEGARRLEFGDGLAWTPDMVAADEHVLYLSLGGAVPVAFLRRFAAARAAGLHVTVAVGTSSLDIAVIDELQRLDARLVVLDLEEGSSGAARDYRSVSDWIARERITLSPIDFQRLIQARLDHAERDSTGAKGRYFEESLCLLFSQIGWLRVEWHSFNNATEEIDLVLSVHAAGELAGLAGGPVAVATAKNERKPTNSQTVKYLKGQMENRNGRCKLGFLCSASTISDAAQVEILRGSGSDALIVPLDRATIDRLVAAPSSMGTELAAEVRRAATALSPSGYL